MEKNIKRSLSVVYIITSCLFVVMSFLVWRGFTLVIDRAYWVNHTNVVLEISEKVISSLKDIETGQRGFLLAGDSSFLEPYNGGKVTFLVEYKKLRKLTSDNLIQQKRLDTLQVLAETRISILMDAVNARLNRKDLFLKYFKQGKIKMDEIRALISRFQSEEITLLKKRSDEFDMFILVTKSGIGFFFMLLLCFVVGSYRVIRLRIEKEHQHKNYIQGLNEELKLANEEIHAANEEIYANNEELKAANEELASLNEEMLVNNESLQAAQLEIEKLNSELQTRMAAIMDNTIDLVAYAGKDLQVIYINAAGRQMMGLPDDYATSRISMLDFHPDEIRAAVFNEIFGKMEDRGVWHGETLLQRMDGKVLPMSQVVMAHKNNDDEIEYYSTIIHDLSEVKLAEEALKYSEQKYKLLFENNPQPMWIYDVNTFEFVEVNNAAHAKYGYTKEEFLALTIESVWLKEDTKKMLDYLNPAMAGYSNTVGWRHLDRAGNIMEVEILSYGFTTDGRNVRLMLINDVTERNKAQQDLKRVNNDLLRQNEQLEKYAYVISHNIRGPVATLIGLTLVFEDEESMSEINKITVDNMKKVVLNIDNVIIDLNKVLSLRNSINQAKEPIKFNEEIENVLIMLDEQIKNTQAKIKFDFGDVNEVFSIKSYIHSIFLNLISNAIKYRHPSRIPVITISSGIVAGKLIVNFSDNGLGIDLVKNEGKIFGLYKRFHYHTEGKGLGLHLVKTQAEALDGKVEVESEPEKGSVFRIILPSAAANLPI